jgi:hypothetical protein
LETTCLRRNDSSQVKCSYWHAVQAGREGLLGVCLEDTGKMEQTAKVAAVWNFVADVGLKKLR